MKCKFEGNVPSFKPVSVTIIFETQAELDIFGKLTNCAPILESIRKLGGNLPDYKEMRDLGANTDYTETLIDELMDTPYMLGKYIDRK